MEAKLLDHLGSPAATNCGGVQQELRALVATRRRCHDLSEGEDAVDAIVEQIEARRSLLARIQELRERIMHERFAGLNIEPLRERRRSMRGHRSRY